MTNRRVVADTPLGLVLADPLPAVLQTTVEVLFEQHSPRRPAAVAADSTESTSMRSWSRLRFFVVDIRGLVTRRSNFQGRRDLGFPHVLSFLGAVGNQGGEPRQRLGESLPRASPLADVLQFRHRRAADRDVQLVHAASLAGQPIEYDPLAGRIVDHAGANQFLHREYRPGWTL